jgi:ankyrin repeat protein
MITRHADRPHHGLAAQRGLTPLHAAADKGHTEVVRQLLAAGAAVDATTEVRNLFLCLYGGTVWGKLGKAVQQVIGVHV